MLALPTVPRVITRCLFPRITRFLVLIAAVQILGGHWAVLQSVAWAKMLVEYAQSDSIRNAISKTFDGEHPCSLCHTVKDGRQQEEKKAATITVAKLDAVLAPVVQMPKARVAVWSYPPWQMAENVRESAPPTPPPLA